jgi:hypothetical protein
MTVQSRLGQQDPNRPLRPCRTVKLRHDY